MKKFSELNPITTLVYFLNTILIPILIYDPFLLTVSVLSGIASSLFLCQRRSARLHFICICILLFSSVINVLTVHRGETLLIVINDAPLTLEALTYGMCCGLSVASSMYHFAYFTEMMTGDKLLYITGSISSDASMMVTTSLRLIPRLIKKAKNIDTSLRATGQRRTSNVIQSVTYYFKIVSSLTTWALESGVITVQSMECRGYGAFKRSRYKLFSFSFSDIIVLLLTVVCFTLSLVMILCGRIEYDFYPSLFLHGAISDVILTRVSYTVTQAIPIVFTTTERIKWNYYAQRI